MTQSIPSELKNLVNWSVNLLGQAIKQVYGQEFFEHIEGLRQNMKQLRQAHPDEVFNELKKYKAVVQTKSDEELLQITHCYSIMLELINRCETAFRTFRIERSLTARHDESPDSITFVLTAHPTEAKAPEFLAIFQMIQKNLFLALRLGHQKAESGLMHLLFLSLNTPIARGQGPSVMDEAKYIYDFILKDDVVQVLIHFNQNGHKVFMRSWVGGDKDGHPGIDAKVMLGSLQLSRIKLIEQMVKRVDHACELLQFWDRQPRDLLLKQLKEWKKKIHGLRKIKAGDGDQLFNCKNEFVKIFESYVTEVGKVCPCLEEIQGLWSIFPGLVVPLELREDAQLIRENRTNQKKMAIVGMLQTLKKIAGSQSVRWYARGLILSMVQSHKDMIHGIELVESVFGKVKALPVIPLLENKQALTHVEEILDQTFELKSDLVISHQKNWDGRFEVMLGYSDSSKESGVFASRLMLAKAMDVIDKKLKHYGLKPIFFHGSGGSVERGGGSIEEQTSWWPKSALHHFKATIQGEMVARNFSHAQIFSRQVETIMNQLPLLGTRGPNDDEVKVLETFSNRVMAHYHKLIQSDLFMQVVIKASPYIYLDQLKIGSRPTKRTTTDQSLKLRAIPWVLCWTQTRLLFPTWWGMGSSWRECSEQEKSQLKELYKSSAFLKSFVKILGFTLAKVDLAVWKFYLDESALDDDLKSNMFHLFEVEFLQACHFFHEITGQTDFLWFRPWLAQSISFRSSMIHPLNVIQVESLKRQHSQMLRDTVTGIACGMLTTG